MAFPATALVGVPAISRIRTGVNGLHSVLAHCSRLKGILRSEGGFPQECMLLLSLTWWLAISCVCIIMSVVLPLNGSKIERIVMYATSRRRLSHFASVPFQWAQPRSRRWLCIAWRTPCHAFQLGAALLQRREPGWGHTLGPSRPPRRIPPVSRGWRTVTLLLLRPLCRRPAAPSTIKCATSQRPNGRPAA